ncbi:thaumatin-like protein [Lactarius psammicola]|nr:thaumatin-like protein [Lactarius psammicola]
MDCPDSSPILFCMPENWNAGRRDCDLSSTSGPSSCLSGGCNDGRFCNSPPVSPTSIANFTLNIDLNVLPDYYNLHIFLQSILISALAVSLVDGYDLPIRIGKNASAAFPCPTLFQGPFDSTGFPVWYNSACDEGLATDPNNSPNCCTGRYNTAATCPSSGVRYYSYISACPNTFVYHHGQEASGTSLFSCALAFQADYTFCP